MESRTVIEKLSYAQNRLNKLIELARVELLFSESETRQRVMQEFFFHLLGSVEYLMQLVNNRLKLGLKNEEVTINRVIVKIDKIEIMKQLSTELKLFRIDKKEVNHIERPFSTEGMMSRIINYRNRVTHRGMNPYNIVIDGRITAYIFKDPEKPEHGNSNREVISDLTDMFHFVAHQIHESIRILDGYSKGTYPIQS